MFNFINNRKHFLIWLISLMLVSSFFWVATPSVTYADTTVLTFTSDIHNAGNNTANNRLNQWLDVVKSQYGDIEAMSFCGDMGTASGSGDTWWGYVDRVMNTVASKTTNDNEELPGVYTTGNHEFYNGKFGSSSSSYQQEIEDRFVIGDVGREGDNYIIYCFGTDNWNNNTDNFTMEQITALQEFLAKTGTDKPIIVLVHFPLHRWSSRYTRNAAAMIDTLNEAVANGQKIILLWGHNHSQSDTNYDQIFEPGSVIEYQSGATKTFDFIYAAAGCMSDSEYGNSASVKGKGLVLTIDDNDKVTMSYLDAYGNNVTEGGTYTDKDPVAVTDVSIEPTEATIEVRESVQLKATVEPEDATNKNVTWSSSDTSVATVSETGRVRGIREGNARITVTTKDGGKQATCMVTVNPRTTPDKYYVITIGDYALSTEPTDDQVVSTSGTRKTYYTGLDGVEYPVEGDIPDNIRWIVEETDGGYYIYSLDGRFLNATYETNSTGGRTSTLKLDDTPDVWTLDGSLDDWEIGGSKLKSSNTGRYMTHEESSGTSSVNLFSIRSSGESSGLIDLTDHKLTKTDAVEATCTTAGNSAYWTCSDCSKYFSDENGQTRIKENSWVIDALGHDMTAHKAASATCTEAGNSAYWSCGRCNKFFSDADGKNEIEEGSWVIAALEHKWDDGKVTTEPTCTTAGVKTFTCQNDSTHTRTEDITALGHDMTAHKAVPATCTEAGNSAYWSCGRCNKFFSDAEGTKEIKENSWVIEALGHDWGDGEITKPATCEEAGVRTYTCKNDPSHTKTEEIKALGHDWGDGEVTKPATCEEAGVRTYTCKNDPSHTKTEEIKALGHDWDEGEITKPATCEEDGVRTFTCKNDPTHTKTEDIAALGHDWDEGTVTTAATCTEAGERIYTCQNDSSHKRTETIAALGHRLTAHRAVSVTCEADGNTAYWSCSRCKKFFSDAEAKNEIEENSWVIEAIGHKWDEGKVTTEPTCTTKGVKTFTCQNDSTHTRTEDIAALGHDMTAHKAVAATCTEAGNSAYWSCGRCGKFFSDAEGKNEIKENSWVIKALGHDWGEGEITKPATCEEDGVRTFTCKNDPSHKKTEEIAALGHSWDEGTVTTAATCTEAGVRTYTCQNDSSHKKTETIAALGHRLTAHRAVSVTCEADGNTAYWSCSRCKKFFSDAEAKNEIEENSWVIEAIGHKWDEGKVTTEPTCTTTGVKTFTCQNDSTHTRTEDIAALGHDMTAHKAVAATCTEAGNSAYWSCERCGKFYSDAEGKNEIKENSWVINALGHDWDEGEVTTEPTCTTDGVKSFVCQNDKSHTKTEKIAALGHELTRYRRVSPTCTEDGNSAYWSCSRCGKFFSDSNGENEIEENSWVLPALGHSWNEGEVTTEPTCTTAGVMKFTCQNNWAHTKTEEIAALGHNMTEHKAVAATCEEDGNSAYWSCGRCNKFFSDAEGKNEIKENSWVIDALGHDWDEGEVTRPATCTTVGLKTYTCKNDPSHTMTRPIPTLGHKWDDGEVTTEPTCTTAGVKTFTCQNDPSHTRTETIVALGHNMTEHQAVAATCEEAGNSAYWSCDRCNKFFSDANGENEIEEDSWVIKALGHRWNQGRVIRAATCTEPGIRRLTCQNNWTHTMTEEIAPLGHNMTEHEAAAATCTEAGNSAYWSCDRCNKFFSDAEGENEIEENSWVIEVLGHNMTEHKAVAATCTAAGNSAYWSCNRCKKFFSDAEGKKEIKENGWVINALGHKAVEIPAVLPTCEETGSTAGEKCSVCGEILTAPKELAAIGHKWNEGQVTIEATCTEKGVRTYTCQNDITHTRTEEIAALGHDLKHHDAKAATCEELGWDAYDTCSRCDYTTYKEIKALDHKWGEWTVTKPATEEEEGEEARTCSRCEKKETREIPKLNHEHSMTKVEAVAPTCTEDGNIEYWQCKNCKRCYSKEAGGDENELNAENLIVKATGHTVVDDPKVEATCTEPGKTAGSHCSVCGTVIVAQETIPATGHSWNKGEVTTEPTCTDKGVRTYTCQNDITHTMNEEIAALGHDLKHHDAKAASCTEIGWDAYDTCTRCDYTTYKEIKAPGHKWGEWTVTKPATEEEEGEEARTCSRCEEKETREIPKLNHEHSMTKVDAVAPTCTEDGNIEYWQCEKCKRYYSKEAGGAENELNAEDLVVEALGHDLKHHEAKAASCTEIGWDAYDTCTRCNYTTYKEIKALGHKWGEWEVTRPATEEEEGEETRTCSRCEKKETREIPKLEPSVVPIPVSPGGDQSSQTGRDGTAVGPGASAEVAEQAIISMKTDGDPKGAVFSKLTVRSPKQTKNSIKLKWKKVSKATSYVIYGNKCGTKNKPKKLATVSGNTKTFKKILKRKLKKGTYYKFIIVALDKDKKVVSTSKLIHVATKGGKVGNHKSVSVKKAVLNSARKLKVGSSLKLNAKAVPQSAKKKVKKHVAIRYESTNKKVATVTGKGIVKARKKGTCYIYAYAQSGVYKRIKVIVK